MTDDQVQRAMYAMETYTGAVPGYRRAHPRGIHFHAEFTPSAEIRALTTAEHLQGPPVPALVRLSNAGGSPYTPDRRGDKGVPLGLAIRFDLASGGKSTWAAASLPNFPARDAEDFIGLTTATRPGKSGKPKLLPVLAFLGVRRHLLPGVKGLATLIPRQSFAHTRFNGLHAYYLVDAAGERQAFRYSWRPEAGEQALGAKERKEWPPQYLISEIKQRPEAVWNLVLQLADPGDPTDDVTQQWPDDRRTVVAGRLVLGALHDDQASLESLVFDPTNVVPGIELSADPILHFRSEVYSESWKRRTHEQRPTVVNE